MATYVAEAGGGDWTAEATWDLGSGYPDGDDLAVLDASSGPVALDAAVDIISFTASAYTDTFDSATFDMLVSGDFLFAAAATWTNSTNCDVSIDANGNLANPGYGNRNGSLTIRGWSVVGTLTDAWFTKKFTVTGTAWLAGAVTLSIYGPSAAWWGEQNGVVDVGVIVHNAAASPGNAITLNDQVLTFRSTGADRSVTFDNDVNVGSGGSILFDVTAAGGDQTIITGTGVLTAGTLTLSTFDDAEASCTANLTGGTHFIGEINGDAPGAGANNLVLGTCNIQNMVAGIDGANLTVTADVVHLYGNGSTTTIKNVDISAGGTIWCHGFDEAGSTGNHEDSDIRFVGGGGGRKLMGVGT